MKIFKKLAIVCLSLTMMAGVAAFTACGNNNGNNNTNSETPATETYNFKVVNADGTPAVGYVIQLCINTCTFSQPTNASGEVSYAGTEGAGAYEIHVFTANPAEGGEPVEFTGATHTPTEYSSEVIVLQLQ